MLANILIFYFWCLELLLLKIWEWLIIKLL